MALNLGKSLTALLKTNPDKKFTARDIAQWVSNTYPDECEKKLNSSKNKNLENVSNNIERQSVLL
jgi:hypothetical protein